MSDIAIRVENLGKMYRIGGPQESYQTFRDAITRTISAPFRKTRDLLRGQAYGAAGLKEEIWALKDVSFEVKHGEVLGIIGRNGAGKSTLLKVLSRITEPTTGYVDIYGRVGALLEVGTGFHPELTGRENIYLNGAILGMSRRDIERKFDEIVDFSGVEKFIDTPVKYYSSGMRLRLGFSVAAHMEPDILVVDEVLAVGDATFQRKCLGKMADVANDGRTVLFVSHNMSAVNTLCDHCIWLDQGVKLSQGVTPSIINQYLGHGTEREQYHSWNDLEIAPGDHSVRLCEVAVNTSDNNTGQYKSTDDIYVRITFEVFEKVQGLRVGFDLISDQGNHILRSYFDDDPKTILYAMDPDRYHVVGVIPRNLLNTGTYYLTIRSGIYRVRQVFVLERLLNFEVINVDGINVKYGGSSNKPGIIAPVLKWNFEETKSSKFLSP